LRRSVDGRDGEQEGDRMSEHRFQSTSRENDEMDCRQVSRRTNLTA
jgi:hypothetical protein